MDNQNNSNNDLEDLNNLMQQQEKRKKENNEFLLQNIEYKKIFDKITKLETKKEKMCKAINLQIEKLELKRDGLVKKILI